MPTPRRARDRATTSIPQLLAGLVVAIALGLAAVLVSAAPAAAAGPRPLFQLPFTCGQQWLAKTYTGHTPNAIDLTMIGGESNNQPILASLGRRLLSTTRSVKLLRCMRLAPTVTSMRDGGGRVWVGRRGLIWVAPT